VKYTTDNYVNPLFASRVQKALRKKRVLSTEEREKKARSKGGFETFRLDKEELKSIEKTFEVCYFCKKSQKAIADDTHKTGRIIMTCHTPGCIGNWYEKESEKRRTNRKLYGRLIDKELCFDLGKMLLGRDPGRLAITPQRIIL